MKKRNLFGALVMALSGALIALFIYTRLLDRPGIAFSGSSPVNLSENARAIMTSMQMQMQTQTQEGVVDFTYAAEKTVHAVVHVKVRSTMPGQEINDPIIEFFYGPNVKTKPQKVTGWGSGVIISADGYIITNNHVIEDADSIGITLNNKKTYKAALVGRDPDTDIALLKIKAENLPFIRFGDSDKLRLGQWVLAVGNPFNLTSTVTAGIISAKGRSLNLDETYKIDSYLQTDAALNMGNSGGALVDTKGELIGITAAIISPTGAFSGNSFAIPVNIVKKVIVDLREYGKVQRAILGANISDVTPDIASKEKLTDVKGVYIASVIPNGSVADAGLMDKDVILKIDGIDVASVSELQEQISRHRPGDNINVTYIRNGIEKNATVLLKNIEGNTNIVLPGSETGTLFGAKFVPLTLNDKSTYDIDHGLKVTEVGPGKLKDIGIRKGTIIVALNGQIVNSTDEARQITNNGRTLTSIAGIQADGEEFSFRFGR